MVQCVYKKGDLISLENLYQFSDLISLTENYWLFKAFQTSNNRKVLIKVFKNIIADNDEEIEINWNKEITELKQEAETSDPQNEYIDSGIIFESGKKQFIIVFCLLKELTLTDEEVKDIAESQKPYDYGLPSKEMTEAITSDSLVDSELAEEYELHEEEPEKDEVIDEPEKQKQSIPDSPPVPKAGRPIKPESPKPKRKMLIPETEKQVPEEKKEVEAEEDDDYLKHISMEYFDRMNPQNYYPLTLNIADFIQDEIAPVINPLTGERKVQQLSKLDVKLKNPIVTIRPILPGCSVVPNSIETDFSLAEDEVTFYVSPVVKGKIFGRIEFSNEGSIIHSTDFDAKVVDPSIARAVAFYGILTSFIPRIITFLGVNFGLEKTLADIWSVTNSVFGDITIASLIAIVAVLPVIFTSVGIRQKLKPRKCKVHYKLKDFRFDKLPQHQNPSAN
ncbi:MAG: hypothetical protein ACTSSH_03525 [Candidatus Heimdallarchaeota archaeon]